MKHESIITAVARHYRVSPADLLGPCRCARIVQPRHVAQTLMRAFGATFPEIAMLFSRNHSSIIYAVRKVEESKSRKIRESYRAIYVKVEKYSF